MREIERSFRDEVTRLGEALAEPESDIVRDAAIQRFEFCFELAWKTIQKRSRDEGLECQSPKACFRLAWQQGWVEDEAGWLGMLEDRNRTSHTYDVELARQVYTRLAAHHALLVELCSQLQ